MPGRSMKKLDRDELAQALGAVARAAREREGLTQEDVAVQVDLVTQVYGRLERGGMLPSIETLRKLALGLRVSADELLGLGRERRAGAGHPRSGDDRPDFRRLIRYVRTLDPAGLRVLLVVAGALAGVRVRQ